MDKMLEVQRKMFTQADARKAFASDPRGFLTKEGVSIPEGVTLPKSLPLPEFEKRIAEVEKQLKAKGVNVANLNTEDLRKAGLVDTQALQRLGRTREELSTEELQQVAGGKAKETAAAVVVVAVAAWTFVVL